MENTVDMRPNKPIWKSYVWHEDKCFFVSTIERTYDTHAGETRGPETLVWEYDWATGERGELIHQAGSVHDHQVICRCVIAEGEMPDEDNPKHYDGNSEPSVDGYEQLAGFAQQLEGEADQLRKMLAYCVEICETNLEIGNDVQFAYAKRLSGGHRI